MKRTMNKRDVRRFHGLLDEGLGMKECSTAMKIEHKTLEQFKPENTAISADAKAKVAEKSKAKAEAKPTPASKK